MKNLYTRDFLKITIQMIQDSVDDLDKWSVYNDDEHNEQINSLKIILKSLQEEIQN